MAFWTKTPGTQQQLIDLLREQQEAQAKVQAANMQFMTAMVAQVGEQAKLVKGYLDFFKSGEKPVVRIMTDVDEARYEQARDSAMDAMGRVSSFTQSPDNMEQWMNDMNVTFDEVKKDF